MRDTVHAPSVDRRVVLPYRIPYADTDQMRVVYYANYFVYFERLRNELIRKSGRSYREIEEMGLMFPVLEAYCTYILPAQYDDEITITGWLSWAKGSRFQIDYEILRGDEPLVTGHTIHNVSTFEGRSRRVPDFFSELVVSAE
jgi:acyl-CoA thioester hydrolase